MKKGKYLALIVLLLILAIAFGGCQPIVEETEEALSIYASFYPIYALAGMVTKDVPNLTLNCLTEPQDGCLRDYQISDRDLYLLAYSADAIIVAGSGLESFSSTFTDESNTQLAMLNLSEGLDLLQGESDEEDSHFDGANPFLYMSISGAISMVENVESGLSVLDPEYESLYRENAQSAIEQLNALQEETAEIASVANGKRAAILAEPLFYIAQMYGMETAYVYERECGQALYDSEITDCLNALAESEIEIVLLEAQAPLKLINAIRDAGFPVAVIDCMTTHSESDGAEGYFTAQRNNAQAIQKALQGD